MFQLSTKHDVRCMSLRVSGANAAIHCCNTKTTAGVMLSRKNGLPRRLRLLAMTGMELGLDLGGVLGCIVDHGFVVNRSLSLSISLSIRFNLGLSSGLNRSISG